MAKYYYKEVRFQPPRRLDGSLQGGMAVNDVLLLPF